MSVEIDFPPASTTESPADPASGREPDSFAAALIRRHQSIGWWALLVFLTLGLLIEGFLGFKTRWYADEGMRVRQIMLRLAHTHGGILAIVHLLFAGTLSRMRCVPRRSMAFASPALTIALLLVPGGFFLGAFYLLETRSGVPAEPGLGVFLVPIGAVFLFAGVLLTALAQRSR